MDLGVGVSSRKMIMQEEYHQATVQCLQYSWLEGSDTIRNRVDGFRNLDESR